MQLQPGQVVCSLAGRDAQGLFVVVACGEGWAALADGRRRPLERPKRKNLRHIRKTNAVLELSGIQTNRALRRALALCASKEE